MSETGEAIVNDNLLKLKHVRCFKRGNELSNDDQSKSELLSQRTDTKDRSSANMEQSTDVVSVDEECN